MTNGPQPLLRDPRWMPAVLAAAACVVTACGGSDGVDSLEIADAWARPTPAGASIGALYMTIESPIDDVLEDVGVDPSIADAVSLHETVDASTGMTGMESLASVPIEADELVSFQPNGRHVMLEGLTEPLVAGQRFRVVLTFREAGERDVEVVVSDAAP